jgi:hypothetical protein
MPERGAPARLEQLIHLFRNSRQHERTSGRSVSVPVPASWYPASLLALAG